MPCQGCVERYAKYIAPEVDRLPPDMTQASYDAAIDRAVSRYASAEGKPFREAEADILEALKDGIDADDLGPAPDLDPETARAAARYCQDTGTPYAVAVARYRRNYGPARYRRDNAPARYARATGVEPEATYAPASASRTILVAGHDPDAGDDLTPEQARAVSQLASRRPELTYREILVALGF